MAFILELGIVWNFGGGLFCHLRLYLSLVIYDFYEARYTTTYIRQFFCILAGGAIRLSKIYFSREMQYKYSCTYKLL